MGRYRVTCVTPHQKYHRILGLGCYIASNVFMTFTEAQVIDMIENHGDTFYVERPTGHVVDLVVAERDGTKFVKTEADGEKPDNLLSLPTCPAKKPSTGPSIGALGSVLPAASHGPDESW
jgi:hypothetical protein